MSVIVYDETTADLKCSVCGDGFDGVGDLYACDTCGVLLCDSCLPSIHPECSGEWCDACLDKAEETR